MSQKFYSEVTLEALNNATTDTDHFLVGDSGTIKYRTGTQLLSDLGVNPGVAHTVSNEVKAGVAINKGQAVYVTSADGTNIIVGLASNASEATSSKTLGLLDATVATNGFANVVEIGRLSGLNTLGATAGDPVWLGVNGNLIYGLANKPYAPAHLVFIGIVTRVNSSNGEIFVNVQNGFELKEIHDVDIITNVPINGDVLGYDGTLWVNKTIAEWLGYTPANASGTTNYVSKFTGTTSLGNSQIYDNGTNVGIGTTSPSGKLDVIGNLYTSGEFRIGASYGTTGTGLIKSNSGVLSLFTWGDSTNIQIGGSNVIFKPEAGSERMRITSAGNVGIGTSSPSTLLQVKGNGNNMISLQYASDGGAAGYGFYNSSGTELWSIGGGRFVAQDALEFSRQGSLKMLINSSGNVGIGTANPGFASSGRTVLSLNGSTNSLMEFQAGGSFKSYFHQSGSYFEIYETNTLMFSVNGGERMRINSSGNVGIGTSSPSGKFEIDGSGNFVWGFPSTAVAKIGTKGTGGSLLVSTPSLNSSYESGFAVDGTYSSGKSVINLSAFGVYSGGPYSADIAFKTSTQTVLSEKVRITSDGNVGIGTSSPNGRLQVASAVAGDAQIWLQSTTYTGGYSTLGYNASTGEFRIKQNDGGSAGITFYTGASASEKMRITPSGNVGIGTSTPSNKLEVNGNAYFSTGSSYAAFQSTFSINSNYAGYNAGIDSNLGTLDSNYNIIIRASDNGNTYTAALAIQSDGTTSTGTTNRQQLNMEGLIQDETIPFDTIIPIKWIKVYNVDDNTHYFIPAYQ